MVSRIGPGLLALVGVREGDTEDDAEYIARKLLGTRLWQQGSSGGAAEGKAWSESVVQRGYELLCVSQFTLHARLKGNKPDFCKAMSPQAVSCGAGWSSVPPVGRRLVGTSTHTGPTCPLTSLPADLPAFLPTRRPARPTLASWGC